MLLVAMSKRGLSIFHSVPPLLLVAGCMLGVGLLLCGCAGRTERLDNPGATAEPFAAAARFLPSNAESYMFQTVRATTGRAYELMSFPSEWADAKSFRFAMAGSDFQLPDQTVSVSQVIGRCIGVMVFDYGPGREESFRAWVGSWHNSNGAPATGRPVRVEGLTFDLAIGCWPVCAVLEDRFMVAASSERELNQALERSGKLESILKAFPPLWVSLSDSSYVICRRKPASSAQGVERLEFDENVVLTVAEGWGPWRLFHRSPLRPEGHDLLKFFAAHAVRGPAIIEGWVQATLPNGVQGMQSYGKTMLEEVAQGWSMRNFLFGFLMRL